MTERLSPDAESNFQPIDVEYDLAALPVIGELPRGLDGTLFRIGPNPQFAPSDPLQHHWFSGDGMVHAFTLRNGRAGYRNRWVRTDKWLAEHAAGRPLVSAFAGPLDASAQIPDTGIANTNIVWHAVACWRWRKATCRSSSTAPRSRPAACRISPARSRVRLPPTRRSIRSLASWSSSAIRPTAD